MGTNYYIDISEPGSEPVDYDDFPHIGKSSSRGRLGRTFIFYISRDHQIDVLSRMDSNSLIVNEYGERITVATFLETFGNCHFSEQDFVFC